MRLDFRLGDRAEPHGAEQVEAQPGEVVAPPPATIRLSSEPKIVAFALPRFSVSACALARWRARVDWRTVNSAAANSPVADALQSLGPTAHHHPPRSLCNGDQHDDRCGRTRGRSRITTIRLSVTAQMVVVGLVLLGAVDPPVDVAGHRRPTAVLVAAKRDDPQSIAEPAPRGLICCPQADVSEPVRPAPCETDRPGARHRAPKYKWSPTHHAETTCGEADARDCEDKLAPRSSMCRKPSPRWAGTAIFDHRKSTQYSPSTRPPLPASPGIPPNRCRR